MPIDHWLRGELHTFAQDVLLDGRLAKRGYFNMGAVEQLLAEHQMRRKTWHLQLWNLLMLELWHRMFLDARPSAPPARAAAIVEDTPGAPRPCTA